MMIPEAFVWFFMLIIFFGVLAIAAAAETLYRHYKTNQTLRQRIDQIRDLP